MKKLLIIKSSIILGFLLLFIVFLPFPDNNVFYQPMIVNAASTEEGQNDIKLNVTNKSLVNGTSYTLKVYNLSDDQKVYFKSDDSSIVSVDKEGQITGNSIGETTITVTVKDGFRKVTAFECKVIVGPPAISITLSKSKLTISVGKKKNLIALLKPNNTVEEAKFTSSDESIATVTSSGKITAIAPGKVHITASIDNGLTDTCVVTVITESNDED